ncbi:MAG: NlpC/P60 family protein [Lachnospiraceae bacterium]|nr:NlpC/P60 family protein [Lachnospiraceae bacterium]
MKKGIAKFTTFCLAAGLIISEGSLAAYAAGADRVLVGIGAKQTKTAASGEKAAAEYTVETAAMEMNAAAEAPAQPETQAAAPSAAPAETEAVPQTEAQTEPATEAATEPQTELDTSMVGTTGFAQCDEYVNVRSGNYIEADVVGKIYNNGSLEILGVDADGWYHVRSGNVEGYVAADYIAIGSAADAIASQSGYTTAEVGAEVLNVRSSASGDSDIIATVSCDQKIEVVADEGEWVKVALDANTYGYVSADYVYTSTAYATGETLEEEQARLDAQWLAYLAEQEAIAAAQQAQQQTWTEPSYSEPTYSEPTYSEPTYTEPTYTAPSGASLEELYQAYLDAQAAADAAVANGADEQTILDTAAAAVEAYRVYVEAQNAADYAAANTPSADTQTSEETYTEPSYTEESSNDSYTDAGTDSGYEDESYEEDGDAYDDGSSDESYDDSYDGYEEDASDDTSSSASTSSAGQSVADYACQFVGNPYVWGGSSLTGGADCSGFTMAVYANYGVSLPHNAAAQSGYGTAVSLDALQPGDLLFYQGDGGIGHVSIYIGGGSVVHASNPTNGIIISSMSYRTPCAARRLL